MPFATPHDDADARCIKCGHPLAGLTAPKCPECGGEFMFDVPATWASADAKANRIRRLRRAPGWFFLSFTFVVGLGLLVLHSAFVIDQVAAAALYAFLLLPCVVLWMIRVVIAFGSFTKLMPTFSPIKPQVPSLSRWLAVPVYLGCCFLLGWTGVANKVRWWIDEPFFRAEANRVLASPPAAGTSWTTRRVGTMEVWQVDTRGGRVHFMTSQSDFLDRVELIYAPPGSTPPPRSNPIGKDWFWTMWNF